ncbi:SprA-related family protein [Marinobacter gudaonensis]|uniref:SprA-related family protein n=1 Tax=Marinobacter gudaonensis TaxID=375760 RepID=A0A1I6GKI8_9GAMM|nr:putative metalloprotease CJM1_0395 family protein [Marinobacter gudaonensis]SFR42713.1 SprA-related family protein [Marinobacter gudaonensis]
MIPSLSPAFPSAAPVIVNRSAPASDQGSSGTPGSADQRSQTEKSSNPRQELSSRAGRSAADNARGLTEQELKQLSELKARDREVRAHESAHQAVGGQYAGSVSYTYQRGPDGAQYAVGGEVSIDVAPVQGDPQATIEKMRVVRAAALAPAEPSGQDRAVAAQAMQLMLQAQAELATEKGVSRTASDAYRDVSRLGEQESEKASSFEPVTA